MTKVEALDKLREMQAELSANGALELDRWMIVAAIKNDMRLGLVHRNVAGLSVMPAGLGEKAERRALTIDELNRLCEAATGTTATLVDLIGRNGLPPSEACAMRWQFADLDNLTVTRKPLWS